MGYPSNAVVRVNGVVQMNDPDPIATGQTDKIAWTQRGTLPSPTAFVAWSVQPRDPAKSPFEQFFQAATFNATVDVQGFYGYNASRVAAAEPFARWAIEENYEIVPGIHHIEVYLELGNTGLAPTDSRRPIFVSYNRTPSATESASVAISCGTKTNDSIALQRDDGAGVVTTFGLFPGDIAQTIVLGLAGQAFEIDANLFSVIAGGNASIASSAGYVQVYGHTHTYIDSDADVVIRPDGVVAMVEFGSSKIHLHPVPIAVPAAPAAGTYNIFIDSADGKLKTQGSGGTLTTIGSP